MIAELSALPALKSLGDLSKVKPTIVVDTREQTPLVFTRLASVRCALQSGDYSFLGGEELFAVERKSIADLVSCCTGDNRERFERELHRLRGFKFKRLLIVGDEAEVLTGHYRSNIKPKAVLNTLAAFEASYDLPIVWNDSASSAAMLVERWVWWFSREIVASANALLRGTQTSEEVATP